MPVNSATTYTPNFLQLGREVMLPTNFLVEDAQNEITDTDSFIANYAIRLHMAMTRPDKEATPNKRSPRSIMTTTQKQSMPIHQANLSCSKACILESWISASLTSVRSSGSCITINTSFNATKMAIAAKQMWLN